MRYRYFTAVSTHSGCRCIFRRGVHPNYYRLNRFMPHSGAWLLTDWTIRTLKSYSHWADVKEIAPEKVGKYIMMMELVK